MSEQPPLTPPSPPGPESAPTEGFSPYQAPAYGDIAPDAPTLFGPPSGGAATPAPPSPYQPSPYPSAGGPSPVGPAPYQMAQQYAYNPVAPSHPLAITSLVLGIIGIAGIVLTPVILVSFVTAFCSPFAIWLGARAKREIRANPQAFGGEGIATGGFITGIIGTVLAVIGLLLILLFVAFIAAIIGSA